MSSEPFSWDKFWGGITSIVGWAKFASFWLKAAMVIVPLLCGVVAYKHVYNAGYNKGIAVMRDLKDQEFKDWLAAHPQQTISGSTVNNNVTAKRGFEMCIWPLRLGW